MNEDDKNKRDERDAQDVRDAQDRRDERDDRDERDEQDQQDQHDQRQGELDRIVCHTIRDSDSFGALDMSRCDPYTPFIAAFPVALRPGQWSVVAWSVLALFGLVGCLTLSAVQDVNRRLQFGVARQSRLITSLEESLAQDLPTQCVVDSDGFIMSWSNLLSERLGWEDTDIVGHHISTIIPEEMRAGHKRKFQAFANSKAQDTSRRYIACEVVTKEGQRVPAVIRVRYTEIDGIGHIGATFDFDGKVVVATAGTQATGARN